MTKKDSSRAQVEGLGGGGRLAGASAPADSSAPTTPFRSPVGCTVATPGEKKFLAWCQEERVLFPSSRLAVLSATGRALVASRDIKMGEVVVEVPDDAVLMADNCSIRDVLEEEGMCKPADDEILEVQGLIIAVMHEKWQGARSRWAPYLALLPDDMSHMPLYWKRGEFEELRGTAAYDKMMGRVQHPADAPTQVPLLWCEVVEPFILEHPDLGLPAGEQGYELYRWATCAVASYSFILGDDKYQAMVPVWDLLNHITGAVNIRLHHCAKRHVLQMIATRHIAAGEELVNNYGELSNAELLRGYGFVEERNGNNHVQIPLGFVVRAARLAREAQADKCKAPTAASASAGTGPSGGSGAAAGPSPGSKAAATVVAAAAAKDEDGQANRPIAVLRALLTSRLRLARRLGLLPQHHVFKVYAGRPAPAVMTALVFLLMAPGATVAQLRTEGRRAALAAAAAEARAAAGAGLKGGRKGSTAAAEQTVAGALYDAVAAAVAVGGSDVAACVVGVYERVVERMLGRYGSSLEEDAALLSRYNKLPPRQRAALLARKPEKEALVSLQHELRREDAIVRSLMALPISPCLAAGKVASGAGRLASVAILPKQQAGKQVAADGGKASLEGEPFVAKFTFGFAL